MWSEPPSPRGRRGPPFHHNPQPSPQEDKMNCFKGGSSVLWQVAGFNSLGFELFFF